MLVLDGQAVTRLAQRTRRSAAMIGSLRREGLWPPLAPSAVLIECLTGDGVKDASEHRFLETCDVLELLPVALARRAAHLRRQARQGSAVDAFVVATAEPHGTVLTSDPRDLHALAAYATDVVVEII